MPGKCSRATSCPRGMCSCTHRVPCPEIALHPRRAPPRSPGTRRPSTPLLAKRQTSSRRRTLRMPWPRSLAGTIRVDKIHTLIARWRFGKSPAHMVSRCRPGSRLVCSCRRDRDSSKSHNMSRRCLRDTLRDNGPCRWESRASHTSSIAPGVATRLNSMQKKNCSRNYNIDNHFARISSSRYRLPKSVQGNIRKPGDMSKHSG